MKPPIVVDSSVALKWLVAESDSEAALALRTHYRFIAPEFLIAECANALWKRVRRAEMLKEEAVFALDLLNREGMRLVPIQALAVEALELGMALDHRVYDCLFLSLAIRESCSFVTADDKLLRKLEGKALPVVSMTAALPD